MGAERDGHGFRSSFAVQGTTYYLRKHYGPDAEEKAAADYNAMLPFRDPTRSSRSWRASRGGTRGGPHASSAVGARARCWAGRVRPTGRRRRFCFRG
jgi:hypothetical protein